MGKHFFDIWTVGHLGGFTSYIVAKDYRKLSDKKIFSSNIFHLSINCRKTEHTTDEY